ncbi:MAG: hypothetical protein MUD01_02985, partial [Chloroflexaceae bacterium]|nr:hypothetical protein [Chloroflexaceae bacterium]
AAALRAQGGWGMWPPDQAEHDRDSARARSQVSAAHWQAAWHAGQRMNLTQALTEAVGEARVAQAA